MDSDLQASAALEAIRQRDISELRDMLSTLCRFVWDGRVPAGKHLWSIPVDKQRDFDCMFSDAFDELEQRRTEVSRLRAQLDAKVKANRR